MSFFGGLDAEKYDRVYSDRELVRRIAGHFATQGWRIAVVSALVILNSIVSAGLPILVSRGIDMLKEGMTIGSAAIIALAVLLVGVANWGITEGVRTFVHGFEWSGSVMLPRLSFPAPSLVLW